MRVAPEAGTQPTFNSLSTMLEREGWYLARTEGRRRQFKYDKEYI